MAKESSLNGPSRLARSLHDDTAARQYGEAAGPQEGRGQRMGDAPGACVIAPEVTGDDRSGRHDAEASSGTEGGKASGSQGRRGAWGQRGKSKSKAVKAEQGVPGGKDLMPADSVACVDALVYEAVLNEAVEVDEAGHAQVIDDIIRDLRLDSRKGEEDGGAGRQFGCDDAAGSDDGLPKVAGIIEGLQVERDDIAEIDADVEDKEEEEGAGGSNGGGMSAEGVEDVSPSKTPTVIPGHGMDLSVASPLPMGEGPLSSRSDQRSNNKSDARTPFKDSDRANHPNVAAKPLSGGAPALRR